MCDLPFGELDVVTGVKYNSGMAYGRVYGEIIIHHKCMLLHILNEEFIKRFQGTAYGLEVLGILMTAIQTIDGESKRAN